MDNLPGARTDTSPSDFDQHLSELAAMFEHVLLGNLCLDLSFVQLRPLKVCCGRLGSPKSAAVMHGFLQSCCRGIRYFMTRNGRFFNSEEALLNTLNMSTRPVGSHYILAAVSRLLSSLPSILGSCKLGPTAGIVGDRLRVSALATQFMQHV